MLQEGGIAARRTMTYVIIVILQAVFAGCARTASIDDLYRDALGRWLQEEFSAEMKKVTFLDRSPIENDLVCTVNEMAERMAVTQASAGGTVVYLPTAARGLNPYFAEWLTEDGTRRFTYLCACSEHQNDADRALVFVHTSTKGQHSSVVWEFRYDVGSGVWQKVREYEGKRILLRSERRKIGLPGE